MGFPGRVPQAEALDEALAAAGKKASDAVMNLQVPMTRDRGRITGRTKLSEVRGGLPREEYAAQGGWASAMRWTRSWFSGRTTRKWSSSNRLDDLSPADAAGRGATTGARRHGPRCRRQRRMPMRWPRQCSAKLDDARLGTGESRVERIMR